MVVVPIAHLANYPGENEMLSFLPAAREQVSPFELSAGAESRQVSCKSSLTIVNQTRRERRQQEIGELACQSRKWAPVHNARDRMIDVGFIQALESSPAAHRRTNQREDWPSGVFG